VPEQGVGAPGITILDQRQARLPCEGTAREKEKFRAGTTANRRRDRPLRATAYSAAAGRRKIDGTVEVLKKRYTTDEDLRTASRVGPGTRSPSPGMARS